MADWIARLAARPRVAIAELAGTRAERIVGVASADDFAIAPLSERRCLFFQLVLARAGRHDVHDAAGVPFDLDDGTGRARIDVSNAITAALQLGEPFELDGDDPRVVRVLQRHDHGAPLFGLARVRCREGVIVAGDRVAATGPAVRELDPDAPAGYRDAATRVRLRGTPRRPVIVTNDPRALTA